jgi:ABC-type transport system substrate-binding protein
MVISKRIGERKKMSRKLVKSSLMVLVIAMLVSAIAPAMANIQDIEQPRLDEIFFKVISDPDAATSAFQQCEVDVNPDMIRWANVQKMINEGNTVLAAPGFHYCYIGINCRTYVPDDAGQPNAGAPLAPLNWTDFRQALAWAGLSEAEKAAAILQIYGGPINAPCNTPVPPSMGVWHEDVVAPGCNWTRAEEELLASGFTIADGLLIQPNGEPVRSQIIVECNSAAPTECAFTQKWVDKWNAFFGTFLGVANCVFVMLPVAFSTLVLHVFTYRNFDLYCMNCELSDRFPDYLYDFFHSSQDFPDGGNSYGLHDANLDVLLETLKWGTDYQEKVDACHAAQWVLVLEDVPAVYLCTRNYCSAFKNYNYYTAQNLYLTNMVNQAGFGADNRWTWSLMHWNTASTGGTVNMVLGDAPSTLHPGWYTTAYEADVLAKIEDGLIATTPNLGDLPWIACYWSVEPFTWIPLGITDGMKIRFQIRSDVKWQDGVPLTIQDLKFAVEYIKNFPRYEPVWKYLVWSQTVDPCTVDVFMNITSQWISYDLATLATMFPKHIYDRPDSINAALWTISYKDWTGNDPPAQYPFMKALIGCGPYVFDYWDALNNIAHVVKFQDYWVDGPLKQNFIVPQRVDPDTDFEYSVEVVNAGSKDLTTGELMPAVIDYIEITLDGNVIDVIPGLIVMDPFSHIVLGPYVMPGLPKGYHRLDCHTYEEGVDIDDYACPIWVTFRADTDMDFVVFYLDAIILGWAFGSQPGPALPPPAGIWDERADIDYNHFVNFLDAILLGAHFLWDP